MVKSHRRTEDFGPAIVQGLTIRQRLESGRVSLIPAEQTEGGIVTAEALRKPAECLLDELLTLGQLGKDDIAKRRHEAGMWLRELYHEKAQLPFRSTGHYGEGRGGNTDRADDMPEHVAWNRAVFNDTMRALPRHGQMLAKVCCHDEPYARMDLVREGLDRLADHRGM